MHTQPIKLTVLAFGLAAITLMGFLPASAIAQNRPQEVQDLIAAHEALAMKIRPLQDRVLTATAPQEGSAGFKPDGVPVRAKGDAKSEDRVPERLRHKDRAASDGDDYGRIKVRLSALEKNAKKERERVMRPSFGAGLDRSKSDTADARKALGALQRELAVLEREVKAL
jgi:hypothetical protein